jgi:crotonobetainyl-CoA:carnitine CoA-transferase CaiB-like acyl-CoA transferase
VKPALAGTRVVELGGYAAGPVVGKYLANYGADVIRIESRQRLDGFRSHYPPFKDNLPGPERAGIFSYFNDGKRSITLNLKTDRGLELARRLIDASDVVVENFTPGTMQRLGLGYPQLARTNPCLVMLSTCNQGQTGPRARQPGFGSQLTSLSGFTHLLGEPDRTPSLLYGPYIDYIAVGYGTIAVLAGLVQRRRTGRGTHIDLSQYEAGLQFLAPVMLDYFTNGRVASRQGNRHPSAAPHGVYPCRGEERWCALSVWSDAEWWGFVDALGAPAWAHDARFGTVLGRKQHEAELDLCVAEWTRERERDEVVAILRQRGLRAAAVSSMADLFADPQLRLYAWRPVQHPVLGEVHVQAPPFLLRETPPDVRRPAPLLGQHTREVLTQVLGVGDEEFASLERDGVLD